MNNRDQTAELGKLLADLCSLERGEGEISTKDKRLTIRPVSSSEKKNYTCKGPMAIRRVDTGYPDSFEYHVNSIHTPSGEFFFFLSFSSEREWVLGFEGDRPYLSLPLCDYEMDTEAVIYQEIGE